MNDSLQTLIQASGNDFNILLAAFAGAVVGSIFTLIAAIFQYRINKRQLKIQIVHSNKVNEILNFQNAMTEILTLLASLGLLVYDKNMNKDYDREKYQIQFDQIYTKLTNFKHRIPFLIDMNNLEHINLYNLIGNIFNIYLDFNSLEIEKWQNKTIKLSQDIANIGVDISKKLKESLEEELLS